MRPQFRGSGRVLEPDRVFCPHLDYRHSVSHLPVSDDGAVFLAQTALGLP
jgi:hypothetical protein